MSGAGVAAMAGAQAAIRAIKASGAIVRVEPDEFKKLLSQNRDGLLVHSAGGLFGSRHNYVMGYKGLVFQTSADEALTLPVTLQVVEAKKIWVP